MIRKKIQAGIHLLVGRFETAYMSPLGRLYLWGIGAKVGHGLRVHGLFNVFIHHTADVAIGDCFRIRSGWSGNPVGAFRRAQIWVGRGGQLKIGNDVGVSTSTIVCLNQITIGNRVLIGGDCKVYDSDFHSIDPGFRSTRPDPNVVSSPICIGDDVFIGAHSIILKGVTIGSAAVVGAGSVVSKSIPPSEIWAGNPARKIGTVNTTHSD